MPGPFYFAWAGGTIAEQATIVTTGETHGGESTDPEVPTDSSDDAVISGIPAGALAGLVSGLRYNISGNGIPAGTTIIAPDAGATSIEMDQPASSAQVGALITFNGPRAPNAPFDPTVHNRFDEDVLSVAIEQGEGDFATLTIDIKNRAIGLLATGRNLWCWLSWDQAWTPEGVAAPDLVPLFNGRLVGVPKLAAEEVIQLQFTARPEDFLTQKLALAGDLMVLPFWDPVWLTRGTSGTNPDTVLEAYSALWHIDRTTLEVSLSDILQGEDGLVTIGEDQAFYDAFTMSFGDEAPLQQVSVSGTVSWEQKAEGIVDVTPALKDAFTHVGNYTQGPFSAAIKDPATAPPKMLEAPFRWNTGLTAGAAVSLINATAMEGAWPKSGTGIGGGWSISPGGDANNEPYSYFKALPSMGLPAHLSDLSRSVNFSARVTSGTGGAISSVTDRIGEWTYTYRMDNYRLRMVLEYHANRKRTETVRGVLVAGVQNQVFDNAGTVSEEISYSSDFVSNGIDPGGGVPIGSPAYRSYFQTDRGAGSFEYLLLSARAKLRAASRSVEITFAVDWQAALPITLRNSVALFDRRIPGGSAIGKVKHYTLTAGEAGMFGEFTIGCTIGAGAPVGAAIGVNSYVDDGYVNAGYQVVAGSQYMLLTDELAYQTLDQFAIVDDGLDLTHLTAEKAVNFCTVNNGYGQQVAAMEKYQGQQLPQTGLSDPDAEMAGLITTVILDLKPLTGAEYHTDFLPAVSMLRIPRTIDLAVPPGGESMWDATHPAGDSAWDSEQSGWDQPPALRGRNGQQNRSYPARARQPDHGIRAG